jgi:hypothetical protein
MTDIRFDRLIDLPLREAWRHEALDFTPWLAQNIDHLSEAIGIPLELTGTEVAVESFSADILARNPMDDSIVLIENQLETTDHTHLGQIMTYLAGLEAQTVIWIAPQFRSPHLSAIRWLNQHTADGFSFFAVKARVVRIGDSPFAPIFEVVEKPNDWERALTRTRAEATGSTDPHSDTRAGFWNHYLARHPQAAEAGIKPQRGWNAYCPIAEGRIRISLWIGSENGGIYVTGGRGARKFDAARLLEPHLEGFAEALNCRVNASDPQGHILGERFPKSYTDPASWDDITDWMEARRKAYASAIETALDETT